MTHPRDRQVVNNAIRVLVARNSATNSVRHNVLALGFRVLGDGGCGVVGIHGVEVTWPNSIVTLVKSPTWTALLDRIGVSAMTHLLLHTSMFCALPNGCYFQMTGELTSCVHT
ncbi:hypothetical protein BC830DRAFT_1065393 [Chytriomyces sp. MP71]|nr:hypothetical protein BC830DRAFT_1065393 [Chytriomyces sp. MP71]